MANEDLTTAKMGKNDEFYTQYNDIQAELNCYVSYNPDVFKDKTILLPCDDPEWSNFTKFFVKNFNRYGIKKLISTSYAPNSKPKDIPYQLTLFEEESENFDKDKTYSNGKIFILERDNIKPEEVLDVDALKWQYLEGDGDFRSDEIKKLRDEADVIITNPPFSLFREFLKWVNIENKKFLIIGNVNAITYNEVFPLIKENQLWLGESIHSGDREFGVPQNYPLNAAGTRVDANGNKYIRVKGVRWFTNIEHGLRHKKITYMTEEQNVRFNKKLKGIPYKKYENYDAIEIPYSDAIPSDYKGIMGVPITFLDKYNPDQFEILGKNENLDIYKLKTKVYTSQECRDAYFNKFNKKGTYDLNASAVLCINGILEKTYGRIFIRNKEI